LLTQPYSDRSKDLNCYDLYGARDRKITEEHGQKNVGRTFVKRNLARFSTN